MTASYQDILTAMQDEYQRQTGFAADDASDIGIRLKVLAAQLAALSRGVGVLEEQAFPQTATGKHLEYHAAQRGLVRKAAVPSAGRLRFSRSSPAPVALQIPAGTVCAVADAEGQSPRFATLQNATLPSGGLSVEVAAQAVEGGKNSNAAVGAVTVLVTPVPSIASVSNPTAFDGGADAETDTQLRTRLLQSYQTISNGVNAAFYYDYAMRFEGVASAQVVPRERGLGTVGVYLAGVGTGASAAVCARVRDGLQQEREIGVDVSVSTATLKPVAISVEAATTAGDFTPLQERLAQRVRAFFQSLAVGNSFLLADLAAALYGTEGLANFHLLQPTGDLPAQVGQLFTCGTVNIQQMEVVL